VIYKTWGIVDAWHGWPGQASHASNVRADAFAQSREEQRHAIDREGPADFGEEEGGFSRAAPFRQFLVIWPVPVQIREQVPRSSRPSAHHPWKRGPSCAPSQFAKS